MIFKNILKLIKISLLFYFLSFQISKAKTIEDCEYLANVIEETKDLPAGILSSISNVEAGRILGNKPKRGWPWTVNHSGEGLFFENKLDAIQYVTSHLERGDLNMDVGCMQISLKWHSNQFSSLEEAFDPKININYAASFLTKLFNDHGDWNLAIKHYHSADPKKHLKYHKKVLAAWGISENVNQGYTPELIKANLTLPISKPHLKSISKFGKVKGNEFLVKNDLNLEKKNTVLAGNQIKNNKKEKVNPKFINDRWDLVLKFRKEFKN